jgi:hypothetical protein
MPATEVSEVASSSTTPGTQQLPCGCDMLAVVAVELMKIGICSKCGGRFPPSHPGHLATPSTASEPTVTLVSRDVDPHSLNLEEGTNESSGLHTALVRACPVSLRQVACVSKLHKCLGGNMSRHLFPQVPGGRRYVATSAWGQIYVFAMAWGQRCVLTSAWRQRYVSTSAWGQRICAHIHRKAMHGA